MDLHPPAHGAGDPDGRMLMPYDDGPHPGILVAVLQAITHDIDMADSHDPHVGDDVLDVVVVIPADHDDLGILGDQIDYPADLVALLPPRASEIVLHIPEEHHALRLVPRHDVVYGIADGASVDPRKVESVLFQGVLVAEMQIAYDDCRAFVQDEALVVGYVHSGTYLQCSHGLPARLARK